MNHLTETYEIIPFFMPVFQQGNSSSSKLVNLSKGSQILSGGAGIQTLKGHILRL